MLRCLPRREFFASRRMAHAAGRDETSRGAKFNGLARWRAEEWIMPVLIIAEVKGQTVDGYNGMLAHMGERIHNAPGRVMHASHPTEDGWRVIEVWENRGLANAWFAEHVAPNFPPGIKPRRTFQDLHSLFSR
jgi:hypothetical protein